jgi:hypothetical protein
MCCKRVFLWRNAPKRCSESSFSQGRKPERRSGTFFPGIGITNTSRDRPNFVSLCVPEPISFKKNCTGCKDELSEMCGHVPTRYCHTHTHTVLTHVHASLLFRRSFRLLCERGLTVRSDNLSNHIPCPFALRHLLLLQKVEAINTVT